MYVIGLIADYETLMLKQFKLVLDILLILNPQLILKVFLVTKTQVFFHCMIHIHSMQRKMTFNSVHDSFLLIKLMGGPFFPVRWSFS